MLFKILIPVLVAASASYADIIPITGENPVAQNRTVAFSSLDRLLAPIADGVGIEGWMGFDAGITAGGIAGDGIGGFPIGGGPQFGERGPAQDMPFDGDEIVFDFAPVLQPAAETVLRVDSHAGPNSPVGGGSLVIAPLPPAAFMGLGVLGLAAAVRCRSARRKTDAAI